MSESTWTVPDPMPTASEAYASVYAAHHKLLDAIEAAGKAGLIYQDALSHLAVCAEEVSLRIGNLEAAHRVERLRFEASRWQLVQSISTGGDHGQN